MISGTLRHEGAVVAEDQEPLARAFGQVRAPGESSRQASGWATVDQVNRRFAAACAAAGLEGRGDACCAAGLLPIAMAVNCTKLDRSGRARIADFCHRLSRRISLWMPSCTDIASS